MFGKSIVLSGTEKTPMKNDVDFNKYSRYSHILLYISCITVQLKGEREPQLFLLGKDVSYRYFFKGCRSSSLYKLELDPENRSLPFIDL